MKITALMMVAALGFAVGCGGLEGEDEVVPGATEALTARGTDVAGTADVKTVPVAQQADDRDAVCTRIWGDCMDANKCWRKRGRAGSKCFDNCNQRFNECMGIEID
jgi:hypothetical protein